MKQTFGALTKGAHFKHDGEEFVKHDRLTASRLSNGTPERFALDAVIKGEVWKQKTKDSKKAIATRKSATIESATRRKGKAKATKRARKTAQPKKATTKASKAAREAVLKGDNAPNDNAQGDDSAPNAVPVGSGGGIA